MTISPAATTTSPKTATTGPVVLRGTGRGLEILLDVRTPLPALLATLSARLEQSPGFFTGNDVAVRLEGGALPAGALSALEAVASRFALRIVEIRPESSARESVDPRAAIVSRIPAATESGIAPTLAARAATASSAPADGLETPRMHIGPVRSGVVLEVTGHLVVVGDVNPGAEVRASGSIVVMGALRGLAHAGVGGGPNAFILALRLEAQQVRVGALIARAGEGGGTPRGAEIAYAARGQIVVEGYQGKLPFAATSPRR